MLKKTTNRKTIAITVLAVLLVALLAFNVTYAYFTDQTSSDVNMTFGIVDIQADNLAVKLNGASQVVVMPGDTIGLNGTITATNTTGEIWVRIGVPETSIKLYQKGIGAEGADVELAEGVENAYIDINNAGVAVADGTGHQYTATEVSNMVAQFQEIINAQIGAFLATIPQATGVVTAFNSDGIGKVDNTLNLNLANATGTITLDIAEFGNLWQNVKVQFTVAIQAIQADHVADATAAKALFDNADLDFDTGILTE